MKCKVCGGTGISNTCVNGTFKPCTFCDGTGEYEPFDADIELDKLDSEPQTNEEWLRQCTTEQFAEWLRKHMNCNFCPMNLKCEDMRDCMEHIKAWLKQPHTDKE